VALNKDGNKFKWCVYKGKRAMKNISVIILVVVIALVLGMYLFSFQVSETEIAVVTTFGKAVEKKIEPGLHPKYPAPIQKVHKFDSRVRLYETKLEETTTRGGVPITVSNYVLWRIDDPLKFLETVGSEDEAKDQLYPALRNTRNSIIGEYYFSQFVNSDPAKIEFDKIEADMESTLQAHALSEYGIRVEAVGIKQIGVSENVTKEVFERMKADRNSRTQKILSEGMAQAEKIKTNADMMKSELLAITNGEAAVIRGKGEAEAAEHYQKLEADPEFAMFLRDIEALGIILKDKSTIILNGETEPIKLLKGVPNLRPRD
jgi:membrane protease subunit HflC